VFVNVVRLTAVAGCQWVLFGEIEHLKIVIQDGGGRSLSWLEQKLFIRGGQEMRRRIVRTVLRRSERRATPSSVIFAGRSE
jgi:hypothetical protein